MFSLAKLRRASIRRTRKTIGRRLAFDALEPREMLSAADPAVAFINWTAVNRVNVCDLTVMNTDGSNRTVVWRSPRTSTDNISDPTMSPDLDPTTDGYQGSIVVARNAGWDGRNSDDLWIVDVQVTATGIQSSPPRLLRAMDSTHPGRREATSSRMRQRPRRLTASRLFRRTERPSRRHLSFRYPIGQSKALTGQPGVPTERVSRSPILVVAVHGANAYGLSKLSTQQPGN